jgi:hypothetical protein
MQITLELFPRQPRNLTAALTLLHELIPEKRIAIASDHDNGSAYSEDFLQEEAVGAVAQSAQHAAYVDELFLGFGHKLRINGND